jgi:hypothetical protein
VHQRHANPSPRDTHLLMIESMGRLGWQEISGYGQRALMETAIGRYKSIVGTRLRERDWRGRANGEGFRSPAPPSRQTAAAVTQSA